MQALLQNRLFVHGVVAVLIFGITQGLKWALVKPWTEKLRGKNERKRKAINTIIYFIPFALGIALEFFYSVVFMHSTFDIIVGIVYGSSGVACYGMFERAYAIATGEKIKLDNPYENTDEGKAVKELMDSVSEDGKIDGKDKDAIKKFWDKIKK